MSGGGTFSGYPGSQGSSATEMPSVQPAERFHHRDGHRERTSAVRTPPGRASARADRRPMIDLPEPRPLTEHGNARHGDVQPEGRRRQDHDDDQPGAALAEYGRKVLLVDFDPQGSLSVGLGMNPHEMDLTIYNLLMQRDVTVHDVIVPSGRAWTCPVQHRPLGRRGPAGPRGRPGADPAAGPGAALANYDVVLIDCQPLGLLTVNALTAADGVIVPLECEYFALRGVALLKTTIDKVRERLNPKLEIDGLPARCSTAAPCTAARSWTGS